MPVRAEKGMFFMAKKVKIRVLSNCYTVITVVLSVICITVSFLGFQKYSVLRSAMNDYVTCEAAAQQFSLGSDILTKQVRLAASSGPAWMSVTTARGQRFCRSNSAGK